VTTPARELLAAAQGHGRIGLFDTASDPFAARLRALQARTTIFASGLSRSADFVPAAWAEHGVGVEAGELSANTMIALARAILDYRCPTFVDTGAYGDFRRALARGTKPEPMAFGPILAIYDQLLALIHEENAVEGEYQKPLMVAPDVVGDQDASLHALRQHAAWVSVACRFDACVPIVPIQRGRRSAAEAYQEATQILGTDRFRVGIPSQAAAFTADELITFLRATRPAEIHILGAFAPSRLAPRLSQIVRAGVDDDVVVSADGNPLRSVIIAQGQGASRRADRLVQLLGRRARATALQELIAEYGGLAALASATSAASGRQYRKLAEYLGWILETDPDDAVRMVVGDGGDVALLAA
jgi:hypothetical protein